MQGRRVILFLHQEEPGVCYKHDFSDKIKISYFEKSVLAAK